VLLYPVPPTRGFLVHRWLMLLVGVVSLAVVLAMLGRAPVAKAEPVPEPVGTSQASVGQAVEPRRAKSCSLDGAKSRDDRDCVTLRAHKGKHKGKGDRVRLKGKVRLAEIPMARGGLGPRGDFASSSRIVVIERAKGGDRWTDEGRRWKRVATVKAAKDGKFSASIRMRHRGLYTFRAVVRDVSSRQVRQDSSATSDSVEATAGVPGYAYEIANDSKHDLLVECLGQVGDGEVKATEGIDFPEKTGKASCVMLGGTGLNGGFRLKQKNPIVGAPSVYNFVGYSNDGNECKDMATPEIKDRDIIKVSIKDAGFWGLGYTGTMTYPDGSSCNFRMLTDTQDKLAGQPTWAKVLEIAIGVVVILALAWVAAAALGVVGAGAGGEAAVVGFDGAVGSISDAGFQRVWAYSFEGMVEVGEEYMDIVWLA